MKRLRSRHLFLLACIFSPVIGRARFGGDFRGLVRLVQCQWAELRHARREPRGMGLCWAFAADRHPGGEIQTHPQRSHVQYRAFRAESRLCRSRRRTALVKPPSPPRASSPTRSFPTRRQLLDPIGRCRAAGRTASSRPPRTHGVAADVASLKAELKTYGPLVHGYFFRRPQPQDLGHRRPATMPSSSVGWVDDPRGPAEATGSSRTVGATAERQRLWRRGLRQRAMPGNVEAITGAGLLHRHHVLQRHRLHQCRQLSHRRRRHRHLDRRQQRRLGHQHGQQLVDQRHRLHLGQPGSRGHLR